jgi:hypothetical protein
VAHWRIASGAGLGIVSGVMKGWVWFVIFHNLRVPCRLTLCNPSWHLTSPSRLDSRSHVPRAGHPRGQTLASAGIVVGAESPECDSPG